MPVSLSTALTTWQFEPLVAVPAALLACCYLTAAWHCGRRPRATGPRRLGRLPARLLRGEAAWRSPARPWPDGRTLAFLGGLSAIIGGTQGWVGVYDETSLADHMVQHLLLIMVAPPLLVAGRPVTLLLHTVGNPWHTRVKRLVRSRLVTALTWPPAGVASFSAAVLGTHLTGLLLARGTLHDAEHFLYLAAGYLFFLPVIGSEPVRWRLPLLGRYLLLLVAMPADIATGAVFMLHGPLGPFAAGDVRAAGVIMLAGSELVMAGLAAGLATALVTRRARDRTAVPDLAAYNAFLASLDIQPEPPEA